MSVFHIIIKILGYIFLIYSILYSTILVVFVLLGTATLHRQKSKKQLNNKLTGDFYLPISILVPAYNESLTIIGNLNSLLKLDYKIYEIIVIDDGSSDDTSQKIIDTFIKLI